MTWPVFIASSLSALRRPKKHAVLWNGNSLNAFRGGCREETAVYIYIYIYILLESSIRVDNDDSIIATDSNQPIHSRTIVSYGYYPPPRHRTSMLWLSNGAQLAYLPLRTGRPYEYAPSPLRRPPRHHRPHREHTNKKISTALSHPHISARPPARPPASQVVLIAQNAAHPVHAARPHS